MRAQTAVDAPPARLESVPSNPPTRRIELPADRGRLDGSPARGQQSRRLDKVSASAAREAARGLGVDPNDVALACLFVLLHRHSQQADLSVGFWMPADDGGSAMTWIRCELGDDTTFTRLLSAVCAARLVGDTPSADGESATVTFGYVEAPGGRPRTPADADGDGKPRALGDRAGSDLGLLLLEREDGLSLTVDFDARSFSAPRIAELVSQYETLFEQVIAGPDRSVFDYSLVTSLGRAVLPDPTVAIEQPAQTLLVDAFEACAERWPEAAALEHEGRSFTYAELERASRALAARLVGGGVKPGDVVAVTGRRSFAVVSSMLGVFRSGAVLLTLDPRLPVERRDLMLAQAGATRLVAVGEADAEVLAGGALEVLRVDASTGLIAGADAVDAAALPRIDPESPAYVFFTSGSTGIPKAVQGRHKGLAHFLGWQRSTFRVGPGDRASQLTALSFDVILRDVFLALTSGGTLCIPGEADALDPARILSWLRDQRITVVHVVPSLARLWLTHAPADARLPTLRWAFLAGEPLTDVLVNRFREKIGIEPTVVNLYGPTETTLAKCYHVVGREPEPGVQPIGRPLPQTQVLILNRRRRVCGVNETGEIAIRTPFRTFGYLNAPEANARAFIPNPFRDDPTDLVYLTGDSGRYRTDGLLEILGRIDNQVKIRGIRVEPGEIEATLGHHPDVREAVVVARDDGTGQKILVAYVVLKQRPKASGEAIARLRDFLRARLPEHMVPSAFMLLEALPLNPNGKVDKKSLPAPTDLESGVSTAYVAPSDDVGQRVARVFEAVMNIKRVGMNDEFFDLGGDSLRAMMLIVRIEQEFGTKLPLHTFWSNGTPAKIAALVRGEAQAQHGVLVTIQAGSPERAPVYWLPGGGGLSVMVFRRVSQLLGPDQPVYGLEADLDLARAPKTLQGLAASYIDAIKARQPSGPYHLLGFSLGTFTAYEMAVQLRRRGDTVGLLCLFDTPPGDVLNRAEKLAVAAQRAAYRIAELRRLPGRRVAEQVRRIARNVIGEMRGGNGVGVPDPALQTVVDQNRRAALDYMKGPLPRFDGDVTIVLANATSMAGVSPAIDPRLAWRKFCDGDVEVHRVPGNHLSMLEPPHVEELGETLRAIVERAQRQRAAP